MQFVHSGTPLLFSACMRLERFIALPLIVLLHFFNCVSDQRSRRFKLPHTEGTPRLQLPLTESGEVEDCRDSLAVRGDDAYVERFRSKNMRVKFQQYGGSVEVGGGIFRRR